MSPGIEETWCPVGIASKKVVSDLSLNLRLVGLLLMRVGIS